MGKAHFPTTAQLFFCHRGTGQTYPLRPSPRRARGMPRSAYLPNDCTDLARAGGGKGRGECISVHMHQIAKQYSSVLLDLARLLSSPGLQPQLCNIPAADSPGDLDSSMTPACSPGFRQHYLSPPSYQLQRRRTAPIAPCGSCWYQYAVRCSSPPAPISICRSADRRPPPSVRSSGQRNSYIAEL